MPRIFTNWSPKYWISKTIQIGLRWQKNKFCSLQMTKIVRIRPSICSINSVDLNHTNLMPKRDRSPDTIIGIFEEKMREFGQEYGVV